MCHRFVVCQEKGPGLRGYPDSKTAYIHGKQHWVGGTGGGNGVRKGKQGDVHRTDGLHLQGDGGYSLRSSLQSESLCLV